MISGSLNNYTKKEKPIQWLVLKKQGRRDELGIFFKLFFA